MSGPFGAAGHERFLDMIADRNKGLSAKVMVYLVNPKGTVVCRNITEWYPSDTAESAAEIAAAAQASITDFTLRKEDLRILATVAMDIMHGKLGDTVWSGITNYQVTEMYTLIAALSVLHDNVIDLGSKSMTRAVVVDLMMLAEEGLKLFKLWNKKEELEMLYEPY